MTGHPSAIGAGVGGVEECSGVATGLGSAAEPAGGVAFGSAVQAATRTTESRSEPVARSMATTPPSTSRRAGVVDAVASAGPDAVAARERNRSRRSGNNGTGQLANGTNEDGTTAVEASGFAGFVGISSGAKQSW